MSDLNKRKQKFIETLTTLGSLLAVFLGFVVGKDSFYFPDTITFGVLFIASALFSYAAVLFKDEIKNRAIIRFIPVAYGFMGLSFALLVTIGTALVLSLIQGTYPAVLVYLGAGAVLLGSMVSVIWLINWVMNLPDSAETEKPPRIDTQK